MDGVSISSAISSANCSNEKQFHAVKRHEVQEFARTLLGFFHLGQKMIRGNKRIKKASGNFSADMHQCSLWAYTVMTGPHSRSTSTSIQSV